ncbi:AMP-binding protein [Streptomyces sp. LBUM 1479]|nr:AMP-binding protein [Streptomyces sp. LBUM 1479]
MTSSLPLTAAQHGVWVAQRLAPDSPLYTCGVYYDVPGPVDRALLSRAVARTVDETEALRVRFHEVGETVRQAVDPSVQGELAYLEFGGAADPEAAARAWIDSDLATPVPVTGERLFRHTLLRLGPDRYWLHFRYHHILLDGYGQVLHCRRLLEVYTALAAGEQPSPSGFGTLREVLAEEDAYRRSARRERDGAYWQREFADLPDSTELGATVIDSGSHSDGSGSDSGSGSGSDEAAPALASGATGLAPSLPSATGRLSGTTAARVRELGGSRWSLPVIAAMVAHTHRVTGAHDVVVRVFMAARLSPRALATPAMLVNDVPLRIRVDSSTTFTALLERVAARLAEATRHQRYPHDELRRDLAATAHPGTLSGPSVNVLSFASAHLPCGPTEATARQLASGPVRDLALHAFGDPDADDGIELTVNAHPGRFTPGTAATHRDRYTRLLAAATEHPELPIGALDLLDDAERERFHARNDTSRTADPRSLVELFEAQDPAAEAVAFEGERLTYGELNARVNRLAHALRAQGVGPESRVAVKLPRSLDLIIALWAVLKTGAAHVPVDTGYPDDRIAYLIADSRAALVLDEDSMRSLGEGESDTDPGVVPRGDGAAYVIHTSGTTGRPKGTVVTHAGIANMLAWMQDEYRLTPADRVVHKTPVGFDVSVWEVFWTLTRGATLVVARPDGHRDPAYLARLVRDEQVTVIHFVPAMLGPSSTSTCPLPPCAWSAAAARRCRPVSPTASTASAAPGCTTPTAHRVLGDRDLPRVHARRARHHRRTHPQLPCLCARSGPATGTGRCHRRAVPRGRPARARLPRPARCHRRTVRRRSLRPGRRRPYVPHRRPGATPGRRLSGVRRTRRRPGQDQRTAGGARRGGGRSRVGARRDPGGGPRPRLQRRRPAARRLRHGRPGGRPAEPSRTPTARRHGAGERLRAAVDPGHPHGKVDRRALPAPALPSSGRAPSTPAERTLHTLAAALLRRPELGVDDDLFALGADSIHAIQLVGRARRQGLRLTPQDVFDHPTVARLATVAETASTASAAFSAPLAEDDPVGELPETPMARRLAERGGSTAGYAQSLLLAAEPGLSYDRLTAALQRVLDRHDALRTHGTRILPVGAVRAEDCLSRAGDEDVAARREAARRALSPEDGVMVRAVWFASGRLLLVLHHLVVDGVSWRILLTDLAEALAGAELSVPGTSLRRRAAPLAAPVDELPLWTDLLSTREPLLGIRPSTPHRTSTAPPVRSPSPSPRISPPPCWAPCPPPTGPPRTTSCSPRSRRPYSATGARDRSWSTWRVTAATTSPTGWTCPPPSAGSPVSTRCAWAPAPRPMPA